MQSDDFALNSYIQADQTLAPLYERFGPAVLVALDPGQSRPAGTHWRQLTFEKTQAMPYLRGLSGTSLAVVCGQASGQLCGIGFPEPGPARDFLARNPALKHTLVSDGPQGTVIWLHIRGFCPQAQLLVTCGWLAEGECVLVHNYTLGGPRVEFSGGPRPVEIAFEEIVWDEPDDMEILPQVIQSWYGPPVLPDGKKRLRINYNFWVRFYSQFAGLQYHPGQKRFMRPNPTGQGWLSVCEEKILLELQRLLNDFGQRTGWKALQRPLLAKERRELLKSLSIVAVGEFESEADGLVAFLNQQVERKPGADVTSEELFLAYGCFCQNHRLVALTRHEFLRQSPAVINEKFGVSRAHDLAREGGQRRGYLNVALRPLEPLPETERTLRTLRTG